MGKSARASRLLSKNGNIKQLLEFERLRVRSTSFNHVLLFELRACKHLWIGMVI